jgi:hypothetical protein
VLVRSCKVASAVAAALLLLAVSCGDQGLWPTTINPGDDFVQEDVVFDDQFFYCRVEPVLFAQGCGSGSGSDPANGCHFSVTSFKLTNYGPPRVNEMCSGDALEPGAIVPAAAQQNYAAAQSRMKRDPNLAPLLQRPIGKSQHPRQIFPEDSDEADVIRQWATQFSNQ